MSADFAQMDEASLAEFLRGLISVCATNMDERSLIPVVKMGAQTERSYLSPLSFAPLLGRLQQAVLLYVIHDGEHPGQRLSAKSDEEDALLLARPLALREGRADWEYFGTGAGELLSSTSFGGFLKARHPEAFESSGAGAETNWVPRADYRN